MLFNEKLYDIKKLFSSSSISSIKNIFLLRENSSGKGNIDNFIGKNIFAIYFVIAGNDIKKFFINS